MSMSIHIMKGDKAFHSVWIYEYTEHSVLMSPSVVAIWCNDVHVKDDCTGGTFHPGDALTFHLHLLWNLVDVILRSTVGEDHQDVGDPPPDSPLCREDVVLHVLDGAPWLDRWNKWFPDMLLTYNRFKWTYLLRIRKYRICCTWFQQKAQTLILSTRAERKKGQSFLFIRYNSKYKL